MRFALVNNERSEATPKLKGICAGCGQSVTAKCGKQRIWHWAHDAKKECDRWWETETDWHRGWKDKFPREWQESIHHDEQSGEKHIADVRTEHGLVIEFQHSRIAPQERIAREHFYKNMAWVVDGTRLKRDWPRFQEGMKMLGQTPMKGIFLLPHPNEHLPAGWLESSAPIFFDFKGETPINPPDINREVLWCLLPNRAQGYAVIVYMSRNEFVKAASTHPRLFVTPPHKITEVVSQWVFEQQRRTEIQNYRSQFAHQRNRHGRRRYARF